MKKQCLQVAVLGLCIGAAFGNTAAPKTELVSPSLVDRAGWTWNWQAQLPIRTGESVDHMVVLDDHLYVLTSWNFLFCLDRTSGATRFAVPLAERGLPVCHPLYRDNLLWFLVGNETVVVDPWAGSIAHRHSFGHIGNTFECGFALNDDYAYITGSDRRLHVFSREGRYRVFTATADNDAPIVSVQATPNRVMFATMTGSIVGMAPNEPVKQWQFDATGTIQSELVLVNEHVYIGSLDTKLYKLNVADGRQAWATPFKAGDRLIEPVVPGRTLVYVPAGKMGVYGVDQATGRAVWQAASGIHVLTETEHRGFVLSRPGMLDVMDNTTGKRLYSVNFSRVTRFASCMNEPKLYIADDRGRLAAITVR